MDSIGCSMHVPDVTSDGSVLAAGRLCLGACDQAGVSAELSSADESGCCQPGEQSAQRGRLEAARPAVAENVVEDWTGWSRAFTCWSLSDSSEGAVENRRSS